MPMDLSAVRALCDAAAPCMMDALALKSPRLYLRYEKLPDGTAGHVRLDVPYDRLHITIDPLEADDEAEVLDSLRHEMLHWHLSEYELAGRMRREDDDAWVDEAWRHATERTVARLERMLDGLGWTPEALAGKPTTCAGCARSWRAAAPDGTETVECPGCGERVTHGRTAQAVPDADATSALVQVRNPATQRWDLLSTETGRILTTSAEELAGIPVRPRA